jgi:transcription-repair coupling factor (superfamily II helicase)
MTNPEAQISLRPLLERALADERFHELATATRAAADGAVRAHVSGWVRAYVCAALLEADFALADRPALLVAADDRGARDLAMELGAFLAPRRVRTYPSRGLGYESHIAPPPHLVGLRITALDSLLEGADGDHSPVVVASATALAEKVPEAALRPSGLTMAPGDEVDLDAVGRRLVDSGYERVDQVEERGQFAIRGGILDVFGATAERAARLELFGDEIESARWFSTFTQRSLSDAAEIELAPAAELAMEHRDAAERAAEGVEESGRVDVAAVLPLERFAPVLESLDDDVAVIVAAGDEIGPALRDQWEDITTTMHAADARPLYADVAEPLGERALLEISSTYSDQDHSLTAQPPASAARDLAEAEGELERLVGSGHLTAVTFESRGEAQRARYNLPSLDARLLDASPPRQEAELLFCEGPLREGFISPELRLAVIPYHRLVHGRRAVAPRPAPGRLVATTELRVGDYVVHSDHGIAQFAGFDTKTVAGVTRDYLELQYKGEDRVFAPTEQLAKITRYAGAEGTQPPLSALGGKRWEAMKARARRAARELAGELMRVYAERKTRRGHSFSPDGEWQLVFERAFPYRETTDQLEAIEAVKADMESERPMDRLICGDVGYGKTEVALRAAHKAAVDGKQTMLLVPTTILAQQHLGTFRERFAETPFIVEGVSRLRRPAEVRKALEAYAEGKVDVLIGTHRLLSRDVRGKDLGLLVVDEEQRFGVRQKELLRQLRLKMDVLSLSATPIPRTLQMSLAGLRDISVIETPPEGRRPIRTYVGPWDERLVGRAIEREVERGGQCFFLHNRVETIDDRVDALRQLCPRVRFAIAHGQMEERELEDTMLSFLRGESDCLVATTIIESGLDVPAANTLIVDRADRLGLAQAYQIRGRVGRSRDRAYAYLLYPSARALGAEAASRLAALSDHTELGSGFAIAMRDLDIRGAGNLLGEEQSGHVAAVGFELYLSMLEEAVRAMEHEEAEPAAEPVRLEADVDAYVPADYVPFEVAKIDLHRRIAMARDRGDLARVRDEVEDRFGPPPEAVENLIRLQRARIELGRAGAQSVELRGRRLNIQLPDHLIVRDVDQDDRLAALDAAIDELRADGALSAA